MAAGLTLQGASDHRVSEAVYLADPEGNGVEIYVDQPVERWTRNGTIEMTTHPLDAASLPDAAPWAGAPAGTRIGHVHLKTTTLTEAEQFWTGLGLEITARYPGGSFFGSGGYHHQIATNTCFGAGRTPQPGPRTGLTRIALTVADLATPQTHVAGSGPRPGAIGSMSR